MQLVLALLNQPIFFGKIFNGIYRKLCHFGNGLIVKMLFQHAKRHLEFAFHPAFSFAFRFAFRFAFSLAIGVGSSIKNRRAEAKKQPPE